MIRLRIQTCWDLSQDPTCGIDFMQMLCRHSELSPTSFPFLELILNLKLLWAMGSSTISQLLILILTPGDIFSWSCSRPNKSPDKSCTIRWAYISQTAWRTKLFSQDHKFSGVFCSFLSIEKSFLSESESSDVISSTGHLNLDPFNKSGLLPKYDHKKAAWQRKYFAGDKCTLETIWTLLRRPRFWARQATTRDQASLQ